MGRDKALLRLPGGETLLERTLATLRAAGRTDTAVAAGSTLRATALYDAVPALAGVRLIVDAWPGRGPLAGLASALDAYPGRAVLAVACDMPRLSATALRLLLAPGVAAADADVVVPRVGGRNQPLHALYGPACRPVAARLVAEGKLAVRALLGAPGLRVYILDEDDLARAGVSPAAFENVNTPAEWAARA